jgi:hypothetical protein
MMNVMPLLVATILVTPPPHADMAALSSLDTDGNAAVSQDELHDLVRKIIQPFDHDADGALRPSDMHRLVFQLWDGNDDLLLGADEFSRVKNWDSGLGQSDFERLDGDGNGALGLPEFMAFGEREMYNSWDGDSDGLIDQFELSDQLLAIFDTDRNGALGADEFGAFPMVWPVAASALTTISVA